jgi:hypothetical protein
MKLERIYKGKKGWRVVINLSQTEAANIDMSLQSKQWRSYVIKPIIKANYLETRIAFLQDDLRRMKGDITSDK